MKLLIERLTSQRFRFVPFAKGRRTRKRGFLSYKLRKAEIRTARVNRALTQILLLARRRENFAERAGLATTDNTRFASRKKATANYLLMQGKERGYILGPHSAQNKKGNNRKKKEKNATEAGGRFISA